MTWRIALTTQLPSSYDCYWSSQDTSTHFAGIDYERRWWMSAGTQDWRNLRLNPKIAYQQHRFWKSSPLLIRSITTRQLFCS